LLPRSPLLVAALTFVSKWAPKRSCPNRREWARETCEFVGYILPFDPTDLADRVELRSHLGYDDRPLVVCSIGGTAIGNDLLELCGQA
jgi:hypothetical protein